MSPTVTDLTARRLRALVAKEQAAARMPSLVAGVVRDGELVWSGSHGGHTGAGAPSSDTQYRIGSITKTMTAVLVMQLRDEGLLDLNDRLDEHLPDVGYGDRTIRRLLSHSSGMQSEPPGSWWERSPGVKYDELAAAVNEAKAWGFRIRSVPHYAGKPLRLTADHGEVRLFHKRHYIRFANKGEWEEIAVQGTIIRLRHALRSVTFDNVEEHRAWLSKSAAPRSTLRRALIFVRDVIGTRTLDRNTLRYIWIEAGFDRR